MLASLSHPNIPAIYDVDFSPGKFSIVFQYIEGQSLRKVIDQGPVQIGIARVWFHQIASALEHAHKLGIVHRDIKPENIIITPDLESAYLVDFGIALSIEDARKLTKSGYAMGTPGYMSPEQLAGDIVDSRSDIYALGVTFWETLSGKRMPPGNYEPLASNEAISPLIDDLVLFALSQRTAEISFRPGLCSQIGWRPHSTLEATFRCFGTRSPSRTRQRNRESDARRICCITCRRKVPDTIAHAWCAAGQGGL